MKKILLLLIGITFFFLAWSQKPENSIDVIHYRFAIYLNDINDTIRGIATIDFRALEDTKVIYLDLASRKPNGKGMLVMGIKENNEGLSFLQASDSLIVQLTGMVKKGNSTTIEIIYQGIPADGLIISNNKYGHRAFFSDNWPDRAHQWLPCIDHPADKASVDFIVTAPEHYQVISNGLKTEEINLPEHLKQTHYREMVSLPTKVMVIGAADFAVNYLGDVDCIPVSSWVYPEEKDKGFYDYGLAKDILSYFIKTIGPYAYRKLANVQSKTTYGGMENASAIFYSENSIKGDRKVEALLAHEIAHQWFGNSVTEASWKHIWLSEGFATYMAHMYLEAKYGPDTLTKLLKEDRAQVIAFSKKKFVPVVDSTVKYNYIQLLNPNSYQKGSWVLHMLRIKLGDPVFRKAIREYYATYAGRNATTEDFKGVMEKVSGQDLNRFFHEWLYSPGQPDLDLSWTFNRQKKTVNFTITQKQKNLFEFPLQMGFHSARGGFIKTLTIREKSAHFAVISADKPIRLDVDPNAELLFQGEMKGERRLDSQVAH